MNIFSKLYFNVASRWNTVNSSIILYEIQFQRSQTTPPSNLDHNFMVLQELWKQKDLSAFQKGVFPFSESPDLKSKDFYFRRKGFFPLE